MLVLKSEDPNVKDKLLHDYEEIRPMSTYSPWNKDIEFWQTMSLVKSSILIDLITQIACFKHKAIGYNPISLLFKSKHLILM